MHKKGPDALGTASRTRAAPPLECLLARGGRRALPRLRLLRIRTVLVHCDTRRRTT